MQVELKKTHNISNQKTPTHLNKLKENISPTSMNRLLIKPCLE
jgi:hypothetical protein